MDLNRFDGAFPPAGAGGAPQFEPDDIRIALSLGPGVPIVLCDARDRDSVKKVLVSLVRHVMSKSSPAGQYPDGLSRPRPSPG